MVHALKNCSTPFAPQICFNENQNLSRFPDAQQFVYAIMCNLPKLSPELPESRQCLVAARALLSTQPRHGMILLVSNSTIIEHEFRQVLGKWNVEPFIFTQIDLPAEGLQFHLDQGQPAWRYSYQKMIAWSLTDYKKVAIIDMDIVLIENIDYIFAYPHTAISTDCGPHDDHQRQYWVRALYAT